MRDDELADVVVMTLKAALAPVLERMAAVEARQAVLGDVRDRLVVVETKAAMPVSSVVEPVDLGPLQLHVQIQAAAQAAQIVELEKYAARIEGYTSFLQRDAVALSERVAVVEVKSMSAEPVDLAPVLARVQASEAALEAVKADCARQAGLEPRLADVRERVAALEARPLLPGPAGEPGQPGKDGLDGKDGMAGLSFEGVYQDGKTYEPGQLATWGGSSWHCNETTTSKPGDGSKAWTLMVKRGRDGKDGRDAVTVPVVSVGRPA